jgi:TPR repeat protein
VTREPFLLIRKAADAGSAKAIGMLSYHYEYGLGVTQDDNKAFELAKLSAEAGDDEGEKMLGAISKEKVSNRILIPLRSGLSRL